MEERRRDFEMRAVEKRLTKFREAEVLIERNLNGRCDSEVCEGSGRLYARKTPFSAALV